MPRVPMYRAMGISMTYTHIFTEIDLRLTQSDFFKTDARKTISKEEEEEEEEVTRTTSMHCSQ